MAAYQVLPPQLHEGQALVKQVLQNELAAFAFYVRKPKNPGDCVLVVGFVRLKYSVAVVCHLENP